MRYTIITPTICRESLLRVCQSLDSQSDPDWEHLVVIDMPYRDMTRDQRRILQSIAPRGNRVFSHCHKRHNNYGHTCRHQIWDCAKGDYVLYLDDDDYLADSHVLKILDSVTEPWGVFPVLRHGKLFFNLPPGIGNTGTGMFIHRREIGRWPDSDAYEADGIFAEELKRGYRYQVIGGNPLVIQPNSSCGVPNAESWFGHKLATIRLRWLTYRYSADNRGRL